eukprot:gene3187-5503_t
MVRFQIASDLHLEFPLTLSKIPPIEQTENPKTDILCLLGDISTLKKISEYKKLLDKVTTAFEHVLILFGNHEFYHYTAEKSKTCQEEWNEKLFSKYENVHVLDRGVTLWSYTEDEDQSKIVEYLISDFKSIHLNDGEKSKNLKMQNVKNWHLEDVKFIEKEILNSTKDQQIVILTHHPPFEASLIKNELKKEEAEALKEYFSNKGMEKLMKENVKIWCFGHTHENVDYIEKSSEGKTRIVSNQVGYYMRGSRIGYTQKVIDL